jgi:hypothetical protein
LKRALQAREKTATIKYIIFREEYTRTREAKKRYPGKLGIFEDMDTLYAPVAFLWVYRDSCCFGKNLLAGRRKEFTEMRQNDKGFEEEVVLGRELSETELEYICGGATGRPSSQDNQGQDLGPLVPGGVDGLLEGVINFAGLGLSSSFTNPNGATPQYSSSSLANLLGTISGGNL